MAVETFDKHAVTLICLHRVSVFSVPTELSRQVIPVCRSFAGVQAAFCHACQLKLFVGFSFPRLQFPSYILLCMAALQTDSSFFGSHVLWLSANGLEWMPCINERKVRIPHSEI